MSVGQQIPLNIHLNDDATLGNFFVAASSPNALVLEAIKELLSSQTPQSHVYLWGASGSGLSHLLQAACHEATRLGHQSQYLPLVEMIEFDPVALLDGLETLDVLCLDDVHQVLGRAGWDQALFHLYNKAQENSCRLLVSANCAPKDLKSSLPDLTSRLAWGTTYRVEAMGDAEKQHALQQRAAMRGLEMSDDVARFILNHGSREPRDLFACLDKLDKKSLAEKRKLSIPFVKEIL